MMVMIVSFRGDLVHYGYRTFVKFMKSNDETIDKLKEMMAELDAASKYYRIREIHMDNGGEYISNEAKSWFSSRCVHPEFTPPFSPLSNRKAERLNRTLLERARAQSDATLVRSRYREGNVGRCYMHCHPHS